MKALIYNGPENVSVSEVQEAKLKDGEVKIKVSYCGICGTDIGIYSGKHPRATAPLILGHEFFGTVEEVSNPNSEFKKGDRVVPYPLISCGECFACKNGFPHVCESLKLIGIDVDGGIAEFVNVDEKVLFKLDESISDKAAAVIEPLAVIVRTLHQSKFKYLDSATIIGAGPIGILTGILLKHAGASKIIISDVDKARLKMCQEFGFETVNVLDEDLVGHVKQSTTGVGTDVVFECSGVEKSALDMTKVCRVGGTICMTATHKAPHQVNLQDINFKEQTIIGSRVYTMREFGQAVALTKEIGEELEKIVTQVVPLAESDQVFSMISNPNIDTVKVIIDCQGKV